MNYRERMIRIAHFQKVDALPFRHAYGVMPGVIEDWHTEGLTSSVQTDADVFEYFGFPAWAPHLPLSMAFDPPFETRVIEETDEYRIAIDVMGRKTKVVKEYAHLSIAMEFPVKDMQTWQDYKRRLRFHPGRVGSGLEEAVARNAAAGNLNMCGNMGFYWFPRDLMGDENLCIAYYEQPELVRDITDTWCSLIENILITALRRAPLDAIFFGEDMAYKNASLISKPIFDQFIKPYYLRISSILERFGVPILWVDSDGRVDELTEWFMECGVNVMGPNEVQAGNDVRAYRQRFGNRMAYDGGLDKRVLTQGRDAIDAMLGSTIPYMKEQEADG